MQKKLSTGGLVAKQKPGKYLKNLKMCIRDRYAVFKEAEEIEDTMVHLRDIIALYIKKHSPLEVKTQGRIINLADR
ncbi:MAG TPA: hypothetical protein ENI52_01180 [Thermoplasmata archaeon]|nr:hypothetical protein [Thermoplasmata archaeon]